VTITDVSLLLVEFFFCSLMMILFFRIRGVVGKLLVEGSTVPVSVMMSSIVLELNYWFVLVGWFSFGVLVPSAHEWYRPCLSLMGIHCRLGCGFPDN